MGDRGALIRELREVPPKFRQAVAGLNDHQLDTPYREGGWTVRQVIHHLADSHLHAYLRMKTIVNEDHPTIKPYDQNVWATNTDAMHGSIATSLDLLDGLHHRWADFLQALPASGWTRTAFHPERGDLTLERMVEIYAGHGAKHIEHIMSLRRAKGW
jgi:hypothetical protein